jgi:hypothetical protein
MICWKIFLVSFVLGSKFYTPQYFKDLKRKNTMNDLYNIKKQARVLFKTQIQQFHDENNNVDYKEFWKRNAIIYAEILLFAHTLSDFNETKVVEHDSMSGMYDNGFKHIEYENPNKDVFGAFILGKNISKCYSYEDKYLSYTHPKSFIITLINEYLNLLWDGQVMFHGTSLSDLAKEYIHIAHIEFTKFIRNPTSYTFADSMNSPLLPTPSVFEPLELEIKAKKYLDSQIKSYLDKGFNEEDFWSSNRGIGIGALEAVYGMIKRDFNAIFATKTFFLDCDDDGKSLMWYAGLDCKKIEDIEPWHLEYFRLGHREYEKYKSNPNDYKFSFLKETPDNQSEFNETKIESKKNGNDKQTIEKYLKPLSGNWNGSKIMSNEDFERLNEYVFYLVENRRIPEVIQQIPQTNISTEFIRQTFYKLHKQLYGRRKNTYWIDFLHKTFIQFSGSELNTTNKVFATYRGNYEQDLENITY